MDLLDELTPKQRELVIERCTANNKFDQCNANTKLFIRIVQMLVKPGNDKQASKVGFD